jgi:hypothetical protein
MEAESVKALRARFPDVPFVLTHLGQGVDGAGTPHVVVPQDFDTLHL